MQEIGKEKVGMSLEVVFGTLMLQVHFTLLVLVQDYKKGQIWIVRGKHFGNLFYF